MTDCLSITAESIINTPDECLKYLNDNWNEIPMLGCVPSYKLKEGQMVRFRGMIQDMPNPVFYFSKYEVVNSSTGETTLRSGKYRDILSCNENETMVFDSKVCENKERRPYYMISVPSVNEWAQIKTERDGKQEMRITLDVNGPENVERKRNCEDMEVDNEQALAKRLCSTACGGSNEKSISTATPGSTENPNDMACIAIMYDLAEGRIKLNDVVEVAGFLYQRPLPEVAEEEFEESYSPLTPRLHVVTLRPVDPLMGALGQDPGPQESTVSLRQDLHLLLTQLFLGDSFVADYLICYLLSRIYHRDEAIVLGKLCLNIFNFPDGYSTNTFFNILSSFLPKTCYVPFTIDNLNTAKFLPKKNYKTGRLDRGVLQLSAHTHLIVDETVLDEGKLEERGVKNVQSLSSVIKKQSLDYDFTYYTVGFATDLPVLILSKSPSILPSDAKIPLKPDQDVSPEKIEESFEAVHQFLNETLSNKIRLYLSLAPSISFDLSDELRNTIQDDFVALRQRDSTATPDDLHELLVLARFMSMSYGQSTLTKDIWEKTKSMVGERKARLR